MRRLVISLAIAAPMLALGGTAASAYGWCGYGYGYGGYRYYAPRAYGYSYYRPSFYYGSYFRPRFAYGGSIVRACTGASIVLVLDCGEGGRGGEGGAGSCRRR